MNELPKRHIVSLSGGKDSTAMLLRMIEENHPIDEILFCDTGMEFPSLYTHLERVEQEIGRAITRLKAPKSFEFFFAEYTPRRKNPADMKLCSILALRRTKLIESVNTDTRLLIGT